MKSIMLKSTFALLLAASLTAQTTTCETLDASIENLGTTVTNQQTLVSKLSDDIGVMSERILTMANKIVATEKLLSDTLLALTGNAALSSLANSVILTTPTDSSIASKTTAPTITITTAPSEYLLYVSTTPLFEAGKTITLYIDSTATLNSAWLRVADFAASNSDVIYIAVKV
ncbi:hypothetical protein [Sulfurimonas sp.]|uniref:hypothetical protein n=1 Tax=Sulfurimonas sp. TaxID=2022749 RepID=UPI00260BE051|nr:hypothetical protein [Sulfurimonas sp.]